MNSLKISLQNTLHTHEYNTSRFLVYCRAHFGSIARSSATHIDRSGLAYRVASWRECGPLWPHL